MATGPFKMPLVWHKVGLELAQASRDDMSHGQNSLKGMIQGSIWGPY